MTDVSFADLVLRMLLSLGIVLAIVLGAYTVLRKRQGFGRTGGSIRRTSLMPRGNGSRSSSSNRTTKTPSARRGLRILARVGIGRTTHVVAVQFADKVYLLGTSEQTSPTILAELDMSSWLAATEVADDSNGGLGAIRGPVRDQGPVRVASNVQPVGQPVGQTGLGDQPSSVPAGLLQALRDATARRG